MSCWSSASAPPSTAAAWKDIKGIEDALQAAYPDWSVRRAFTAQIIINHVQARDGEKIDNMDQALDRAVANGVKNLVVQPTHLMHGAEYDEMCEADDEYKDKFESVAIAEPLLGEVGADATVINADKEAVAKAITAAAVQAAGYDDAAAAAARTAPPLSFMGHGTSHTAKVSYSQMQTRCRPWAMTTCSSAPWRVSPRRPPARPSSRPSRMPVTPRSSCAR